MKKEDILSNAFRDGWLSCGTIIGIISAIISVCLSVVLLYYGFKTGFIEVIIAGVVSFAFYFLLLFVETKAFIRKIIEVFNEKDNL